MKLMLSDWASLAEILGTAAVVISLLLVVRSVDENSRVIESAETSKIWDAWREVSVLPLLERRELAATSAKVGRSEALSEAEQIQWDTYMAAQIDVWAQLHSSYSNGLIGPEYWEYWHSGFWRLWDQNDYNRIYESGREFYAPAFPKYIDAQLSKRDSKEAGQSAFIQHPLLADLITTLPCTSRPGEFCHPPVC